MRLITAYATQNPCYQAAQKMTPKGIVVHSTGANNPYLRRYVDAPAAVGKNAYDNHWNNVNMQVCVHAFIGYDIEDEIAVANILPYNYKAWGVGSGKKGSYNNSRIQFEICEDDLTDYSYFKKVWAVAVEYCAMLCKEFNLDPLGANVIVGHYEAHALGYGSNHADPKHWFSKYGKTMDDFREAVKAEISGSEPVSPKVEETVIYRVQVGAYAKKTNASAMATKLKARGYEAIIVMVDGLYKVQVGAYGVKANAESMAAKLRADGFNNIISKQGGETVANNATVTVGSSVRVKPGSKTYVGGSLASFVFSRVHKVSAISGDRAVITYNGVIVAAVHIGSLELA